MEVTRRFWGGVGLCAFLGAGAILLRQPLLLVGTVTVGAWILGRQYLFVRSVAETLDELTVVQNLSRTHVATNDELGVTLEATVDRRTSLPIAVESIPPVATGGAGRSARTVTIGTGEREAATTFTLDCPVAGRFEFDSPVVTMTDRTGFFRRSIRYGSGPTITVETYDLGDLRVRKAQSSPGESYGEWKTGGKGLGMDFAEIREYVAGDAIRRVDWKATARLNELHVREFEDESDRSTALVADRRPSMGTGQQGRTKLDYARHVALGWLSERGTRESIGLYVVGQQELGVRLPPGATAEHYARIRTQLYDLVPVARDSSPVDPETEPKRRPPDAVRRAASRLQTDSSTFGTKLTPLFDDPHTHVHEIETDPLYRTVRRASRVTSTAEIVVITDDTDRTEVREAVRSARRGGVRVVLFLAPTVLFERGGAGDVEATYRRYEEYESFRRDLEGLERVTVFEYAPGRRVDAMLNAKRNRTLRRSNE